MSEEGDCHAKYQQCVADFTGGKVFRSTQFRAAVANDPSLLSLVGCQNTCPSPPPPPPSPPVDVPPPDLAIKLCDDTYAMNGASATCVESYPTGAVSIYYKEEWYPMYAGFWWDNDHGAAAVCQQIHPSRGYTGGVRAEWSGGGTGPWWSGGGAGPTIPYEPMYRPGICKEGDATIGSCTGGANTNGLMQSDRVARVTCS